MTEQQDLALNRCSVAPRGRSVRVLALSVLAALSITAAVGASVVAAAALPGSAASASTRADLSTAVAGMPLRPEIRLGEQQSGINRSVALPGAIAPGAARSNTVALVQAPNSPIGAWLYPALSAVLIPLLSVVLLLLLAIRRRRLGLFGDPRLSLPSGMEPFFV